MVRFLLYDKKWLDEDPEKMKKLPPKGEMVDSFQVRCDRFTPFRGLLGGIALIPMFLFFGGHHMDPIINAGTAGKIGSLAFIVVILAWIAFLGRDEKDCIEIYPEMIVLYDYDPDREEARPTWFYYWKDVVQYSKKENAIWFNSVYDDPFRPQVRMKKLRPYLEKYAPQAKVVTFNVDAYLDRERKKRWKKENAEYNRLMKERRAKERAAREEAKRKAKEQAEKEEKEEKKKD